MNAPRTFFAASRPLRFSLSILAAALLAGLLASASLAGMRPAPAHSLGSALSLIARIRAVRQAQPVLNAGPRHLPNGRTLLPYSAMRPGAMRPGALRSPRATNGSNTVPIPGATQTFDVFNPAPAFQPLVGYTNPDGSLGNNPQNPPAYQAGNALTPTNLTPVWSADERFLIFSSNRTKEGTIQPDGRFHLWVISVNGGEAYQATTSTTGTGEFFPTLSANDGKLAFISDAQSPGVQNLYVLNQFSYSVLVGLNNVQQFVNVSQPDPAQGGITSVTMRGLNPDGSGTPDTGFDQVQRPVFSPNNDSELVFSARSVTGTNAGHYHVFFLFTTSGGFDPNNVSLPGKLTDGPAEDTDPSWSKDGQFITFASTATRVQNQPAGQNSFGPNPPNINGTPVVQDPNQSQSLTVSPTTGGLRSIFLLGGGTRGLGFGVVPASLQTAGGRLTAAGTDNFAPAWSFMTRNQYLNPTPGFEYLAFSRGASPAAPHDIYYLQAARIVDAVGESRRSSEFATSPVPFLTPLYQIDAGHLSAPPPAAAPYSLDEFFTGATAPPGGVENQAGPFDTSTDRIAPSQIYNTDRTDATFSYDIPNLTPGVSYTVILHFLDPTSTAAGQRLFNLTINGQQRLNGFDIYASGGAPVAPSTLNRAVLVRGSVAVPNGPSVFDAQGRFGFVDTQGDTIQSGHIFLRFTQTNPAKGNPIIQGIDVYSSTLSGTGTQASPSSGFGLVVPTGDSSAPANIQAIGDIVNGAPQVTLTAQQPLNSSNLGKPVAYNIYRSAGGLTSENNPNNGGGGAEGVVPYQANFAPDANGNLRFVDTNVQSAYEYFYQVTAVYQESITPEGAPEPNNTTNQVIKLNTDDNAGQTSNSGNVYDDIYPAWSPGLSLFSITYASNRTVTYNDPATSFPTEAAVSVGRGGVVKTSDPNQLQYAIGSAYSGVFESQVLNLDPPTLLRFSPNEIIHVQSGETSADPVNGTPTKFQGLNPGRKVTFTVRMSDREAGIDNGVDVSGNPRGPLNGGPAGAQVYLQIKNPNSKYQDAQSLEHKVFARDDAFNTQANRATLNDVTSGTANSYLGLGFDAFEGPFNVPDANGNFTINLPTQKWSYPPYGPVDQTAPATNHIEGRGAHGGHWLFPSGNNPDNSYIFIGRNGGGLNPQGPFIMGGALNGGPGGDPSRFIPQGPEYECQLLNPQFATSGQPNGPGDPSPADFTNPYWLAGVDDQGSFSGRGRVRPTTNGTKADGSLAPAEWLQMTRVPAAQQDNKGGVLYTATLTTPLSASDFYLDVIAYDQAVFPNIPPGTSRYVGGQVNWRIYDNVGGFSTVQSLPNNDILVVSDYALGQKFAATTFAGRNNNLNLVPKVFGTESYLTDVDVSLLPDSVYGAYAIATVSPGPPPSIIPPFTFVPGMDSGFFGVPVLNALGVGSFYDRVIDDGGRRDGNPDVGSQRYALWRILSRGPVPDAVLNSYLPSKQVQPAITDILSPDAAYKNIAAGTVLDAHRCVIWLSPYTGDLLTDPGTLDDPGTPAQNGVTVRLSTQTVLRNFVLGDGTAAHPGGGRLFITGQDVGSALTLAGSVGNTAGGFLPDVLNATLASPGSGTRLLTATANRITGNPNYDGSAPAQAYPQLFGTLAGTYIDGTNPFRIPVAGGQYPYLDTLALGSQDYNDGALDQIDSRKLINGASVQGQIDTIVPANGAAVAMSYNNGAGALVYHDDPLRTDSTAKPGTPNGGAGSRVVYAGFGLEAMSSEFYSSDAPNPDSKTVNHFPVVIPHNVRQQILHNIICYLRTGSVSGIITQTAGTGQGAGQGVTGVTVYLKPTGGAPPTRAAFSATTAGDGRFTISGVEPGTYTLVAYKAGFTRAVSNANVFFTIEGDVNLVGATLTVAPLPPGQIAGNIKDKDGKPIVGATATFTSQDKTIIKTTVTRDGSQPNQPAGSYFVDNVPVTNYTATAQGPLNAQGLPEYTDASAPDAPYASGVTVQANTTTGDNAGGGPPVTFTLTPIQASISGRIYDNTPAPVGGDNDTGGALTAGATVTLTDAAGKAVTGVASVTADAKGNYSFTGIPVTQTATTYTITATKAGYATTGNTTTASVTLGSKITAKDIGLTPIAAGTLRGTVTDVATGAGVGGALVTFVSSDGSVTLKATADAGGNYVISKVPPGTYNGTATGPLAGTPPRPTYINGSASNIVVAAGANVTVNFTVTAVPSVSGTVTDHQTGKPIAGATVSLTDPSGKVIGPITTGADGVYRFTNLPLSQSAATNYTLAATATGYFPSSQTVTVGPSDALTVPIALDEKGTVTGLITDSSTGLPLPGATVTLTDTTSNTPVATTPSPVLTSGTATAGPDGKPANYTATFILTPGHSYAVTVAKSNFNPAAAVAVTPSPLTNTQPGRADLALRSSIGTVGGLVTNATDTSPLSGATVTVTDSAGKVTATFVTNGSASAGPDGKALNYSGPVPQGTYTVTLTKGDRTAVSQKSVVVTGGQFNRVDFTGTTGAPVLFTFPAGLQFVSTPYDYSALGFDALFGALNTAPTGTTPNGNRSHVAVWDPTVSQYALDPAAPADSLKLGVGYWVFLKNAVNVTQQGATPTAAFVPVALHPSWNQIGVPRTTAVSVADLQFDNGAGGKISYASAASSQYAIIPSGTAIYSFDGASYQPVSQAGTLQPWKAYWIRVNVNATLEIPTR